MAATLTDQGYERAYTAAGNDREPAPCTTNNTQQFGDPIDHLPTLRKARLKIGVRTKPTSARSENAAKARFDSVEDEPQIAAIASGTITVTETAVTAKTACFAAAPLQSPSQSRCEPAHQDDDRAPVKVAPSAATENPNEGNKEGEANGSC
jgi:hypothetical protein